MELLDSPNPSIGGLARHHKRLVRQLSKVRRNHLLAAISGLLTVPAWQASALRIEVLQHFAVASPDGIRDLRLEDLRDWLDELGSGPIGRLEDPSEDVFVSRVLGPDIDYLVFDGLYETAGFFAERFINVIDRMPPRPPYTELKASAHALLRLSTAVVTRSGAKPFCVGATSPVRSARESLPASIDQLLTSTILRPSDLTALSINRSHLEPFILAPQAQRTVLRQQIGESVLERRPIVQIGEDLCLALPAAVSMAIRYLLFDFCVQNNLVDELHGAYADESRRTLSAIPILGQRPGAPISFQRVHGVYAANIARYVDDGRLMHICAVVDDVATFARTGMIAPDPDDRKYADAVSEGIDLVHKQFRDDGKFREAITVVVMCPWGRPVSFGLARGASANWRVEPICLADLDTLSWEPDFTPLALWRLVDSVERLGSMGVQLMNCNGLINLYGWSKQLNGHLIPHGEVPDALDGPGPILVWLPSNLLLEIRARLATSWNLHHAVTWDGRRVRVRRETISSFFDEDRDSPTYVSLDDLSRGALAAVYESPTRNWWVAVSSMETTERGATYQLWHMAVIWLRRSVPVLERYLPNLPATPLLWSLRFGVLPDLHTEYRIPPVDQLGELVKTSIGSNTIEIAIDGDFLALGMLPQNVGERYLVELLVTGAMHLAGEEVDDDVVTRIVDEVVPDQWARDLHLMPPKDFRDFTRHLLPSKPCLIDDNDDAYCRLGLGWRSRARDLPAQIKGIDACCAYLNSVVDTVWRDLRSMLQQYDQYSLIRKLVLNHESIAAETDQWQRTARAVLSLHIDKAAVAKVSTHRISEFNAAAVCTRILLEMAVCECPSTGRSPGEIDVSRMLSLAMLMYYLGGCSDAIRYGAKSPEVRVTPFGDVFTDVTFDNQVVTAYGEAFGIQRFYGRAEGYATNYKRIEFRESARSVFEPEFWLAWAEHFGFSIDALRTFLDNIDEYGLQSEAVSFALTLEEVTALDAHGSLPPPVVTRILDSISLVYRSGWDTTPSGFAQKDWHPWRFRRRLSAVARPVFQMFDGRYLIAPAMVRGGVTKLIDYCYRGGFDARDFPPGRMRSWIGHAENKRGHEFNETVANRLREVGWNTKCDLKLTEILRAKTPRDFGDVDVLAWKDNRIVLLECKDLEIAMTTSEIARQLHEFRGEYSTSGRPDRLRRHLQRADYLKEHMDEVRRYTACPGDSVLEIVLVFSEIVPMHFSAHARDQGVRLTDVSDLASL